MRHPLNELARVSKTARIELGCYVTGVIVTNLSDGTTSNEYVTQWRCELESDEVGEIVGRGQTPMRAVESALRRAQAQAGVMS